MLAGKYEIIEVDKLAKVTFDLILSGSYGLALVLALVAQGAPVNFVDVDKSLVFYYQLKVVRDKLTRLAWSCICDGGTFGETAASLIIPASVTTSSSAVSSSSLNEIRAA